ncbi:hypothetical protein VTH82DRAFT_4326 [Thermothelomyces myriococcoides]
MPSSLPVPSKAALTALRGLVVGTSCTLALIAEDRRRKINKAMRAIENGERIKSAKRYRAGGAALALAMEEEALWDPRLGSSPPPAGLELQHQYNDAGDTSTPAKENNNNNKSKDCLHQQWEETHGSTKLSAEAHGISVTTPKEKEGGDGGVTASTPNADDTLKVASSSPRTDGPAETKSRSSIRPLHGFPHSSKTAPGWASSNAEMLGAYTFPTVEAILVKIHEACDSRDYRKLSDALRTVLEAMAHKLAPDNLDQPWIEATGRLCRTFQEEGHLEDAAKLLYHIICRGPVRGSDYLNHEPFTLIESLLARADVNNQGGEASAASDIDSAVNLFVPKFTERPAGPNPRVYELGRRLLEACFAADRLQRIFGIYRRCISMAEGSWCDLSSWFLTKLHEKKDHTSVVKLFISTFPQSSPTEESLHAIGDIVVDSVKSAGNHRPEEVLRTMHDICTSLGSTKMSPKWVTRLLVSHWRKHRDFGQIENIFWELRSPKLRECVFRHASIYRVMIELALEAGEEFKADNFFALAVSEKRSLASDVGLLGVFARFHAADGDWEAVRADFEAMNKRGTPTSRAYGRVFVSVLKAYAETHAIRETEAFLRSYIEEFKVPLCSYIVTLMAKHYAAIRDVDSLIGLLDYCSRVGFPVDAAFTNAILVRCRREWNFPFRELRTLFRKLRALNPDWVDKHTEQIMADSALSDSRYGGKAARGRLLSLRLDLTKDGGIPKGGHTEAEEVVLAMKEALICGSPRRALSIYHRAVHTRVPFSQRALQLAVQAHLTRAPNKFHRAYTLLQKAQAKGEDVTPTINYLLAKQLSSIITPSRTNRSETDALIRETLESYRHAGIRLTETSLHRAATLCLEAGYPPGAVQYALAAAEARGAGTGPCFNLANFRILLAAYAELVDANGLRDTIQRALASKYREKSACRIALRQARARVTHSPARALVPPAEWQRARAVEARLLEAEALRIMCRAAADAGRPPVDFDEIPWLGGGGKKTTKTNEEDDAATAAAATTTTTTITTITMEEDSGEKEEPAVAETVTTMDSVGSGEEEQKKMGEEVVNYKRSRKKKNKKNTGAGAVGLGKARKKGDISDDELVGSGFYADLEQLLVESSSGTAAVEAF